MNKPELKSDQESADDSQRSGPNLLLIYGVILLALLVAIGIATLVVWPFYQHRH